MRLLFSVSLCLLLFALPEPCAPETRKNDCAETKAKIRRIESRMRQGYTAKQGVRMEDELRRLRERRKRLCR